MADNDPYPLTEAQQTAPCSRAWEETHRQREGMSSGRAVAADRDEMLLQAQIERDRMVQKILLCNCTWPVVIYRNGDGHEVTCPVHVPLGDR